MIFYLHNYYVRMVWKVGLFENILILEIIAPIKE